VRVCVRACVCVCVCVCVWLYLLGLQKKEDAKKEEPIKVV
jgi:hypothetical protein